MSTAPGSYWPESPYVKAFYIVLLIGPFAFIGTFIDWDVWFITAIPSASVTFGWLGRRLL